MANPDYSEFSLSNTLDLLKLCLECEEFPKYSEKNCKFIEYPEFLEYSTTISIGNAIFVWIVPIIWDLLYQFDIVTSEKLQNNQIILIFWSFLQLTTSNIEPMRMDSPPMISTKIGGGVLILVRG